MIRFRFRYRVQRRRMSGRAKVILGLLLFAALCFACAGIASSGGH